MKVKLFQIIITAETQAYRNGYSISRWLGLIISI